MARTAPHLQAEWRNDDTGEADPTVTGCRRDWLRFPKDRATATAAFDTEKREIQRSRAHYLQRNYVGLMPGKTVWPAAAFVQFNGLCALSVARRRQLYKRLSGNELLATPMLISEALLAKNSSPLDYLESQTIDCL